MALTSSRRFSVVIQGILPLSYPFHSYFHSHFHFKDPQLLDFVRVQSKLGFRNPDLPLSLFNQLLSLKPRPSIVVFTQLLTAMTKFQPFPPFPTVISLFHRLHSSGFAPNLYSLGILSNCYCRLGRVDFAFSLLAKCLKLGFPLDQVIFNTLLNGLVQNGQFPQAVQLLDQIVKLGIQPSLVTYGTMFKVICRSGHNIAALNLLQNMQSNADVNPDVVIYSTIIVSPADSWGKYPLGEYVVTVDG